MTIAQGQSSLGRLAVHAAQRSVNVPDAGDRPLRGCGRGEECDYLDVLDALLKAAAEGSSARDGRVDEDDLLRAALSAWSDQTKELLIWLESQGNDVARTRTPKQVMALGSLRTHMVMSLKALKYAES